MKNESSEFTSRRSWLSTDASEKPQHADSKNQPPRVFQPRQMAEDWKGEIIDPK